MIEMKFKTLFFWSDADNDFEIIYNVGKLIKPALPPIHSTKVGNTHSDKQDFNLSQCNRRKSLSIIDLDLE